MAIDKIQAEGIDGWKKPLNFLRTNTQSKFERR